MSEPTINELIGSRAGDHIQSLMVEKNPADNNILKGAYIGSHIPGPHACRYFGHGANATYPNGHVHSTYWEGLNLNRGRFGGPEFAGSVAVGGLTPFGIYRCYIHARGVAPLCSFGQLREYNMIDPNPHAGDLIWWAQAGNVQTAQFTPIKLANYGQPQNEGPSPGFTLETDLGYQLLHIFNRRQTPSIEIQDECVEIDRICVFWERAGFNGTIGFGLNITSTQSISNTRLYTGGTTAPITSLPSNNLGTELYVSQLLSQAFARNVDGFDPQVMSPPYGNIRNSLYPPEDQTFMCVKMLGALPDSVFRPDEFYDI